MLERRHAVIPAVLLAATLLIADEAKAPEGKPIIVVDSAGREQKLKAYEFTQGIIKLSWLAGGEDAPPDKGKGKGKGKKPPAPKSGPEALVVRDAEKIAFLDGVITFVPLTQLKSVEFDTESKTMTATAATAKGDVKLTGTTAYKGINKVALEADVDKGDAGVASVVYSGGTIKGNLKAIRFPDAKGAAVLGRPAIVESSDKGMSRTDAVFGLTPIYQMPSGRLVADPTLLFKKTLRLDVGKVKKIRAAKEESDDTVWDVTQKDGEEGSLTLLVSGTIQKTEDAKLYGLVGRVPEGWRLFPVRRVVTIEFDQTEAFKADLKMPRPVED